MVMRVSLASANVQAGALGTFEKMYVETRGGRLRVISRQGQDLLNVEAVAVRKLANRQFEADVLVDGEQQLISFQRSGCGCGK